MQAVDRFATYWADKASPEWDDSSDDYYRRLAAELRLLWLDHEPARVLDLGCGSGELFAPLGFDRVDYRGVDFSQSMLDAFRRRHPGVTMSRADASSYCDGSSYDLILANGVVQYLDSRSLDRCFANARAMMNERSLFACANIPRKALFRRFAAGEALAALRRGDWRQAMAVPFNGAGCGFWYDRNTIGRLAARHGMMVTFYGSMLYLYRFHAVLRLATA